MMLLHDGAAMAHALTLDLDPQLHALLADRIGALTSGEHDLTAWTEICVIEPADTEADLIRALGATPLEEPMDGYRWPDPLFFPHWDWLQKHEGIWEMLFTYGSTFACFVIIPNRPGVLGPLREMCRHYAR